MQTNVAQAQPLTHSKGLSKRFRLWVLLGLQAVVFIAVTRPLFRHMLVNAGETDARSAVRLIARQLATLPEVPSGGLAQWMQGQDLLLHRLGDARLVESRVEYHGYKITWKAATEPGPSRGTLWALPIAPGETGRTHFHIQVH